jgi:hypothetical protein
MEILETTAPQMPIPSAMVSGRGRGGGRVGSLSNPSLSIN